MPHVVVASRMRASSLSVETPTTRRPCGPQRSSARLSAGTSARHGAQYVAQNATTAGRSPTTSRSVFTLPSRSVTRRSSTEGGAANASVANATRAAASTRTALSNLDLPLLTEDGSLLGARFPAEPFGRERVLTGRECAHA